MSCDSSLVLQSSITPEALKAFIDRRAMALLGERPTPTSLASRDTVLLNTPNRLLCVGPLASTGGARVDSPAAALTTVMPPVNPTPAQLSLGPFTTPGPAMPYALSDRSDTTTIAQLLVCQVRWRVAPAVPAPLVQ